MAQTLSKSEQRRIAAQKGEPAPGQNNGAAAKVVGTHPDEARDLPEVKNREEAQGEEIPGQPAAVIKNRIPVPEVSRIGEKIRP